MRQSDLSLTFALLIFAGGFGSAWATEVPRCTKTSTSCLDTVTHKARTCVTETCTYADGHTTTSVTVEAKVLGGSTGPTHPTTEPTIPPKAKTMQ
jgi:hypothetical protein